MGKDDKKAAEVARKLANEEIVREVKRWDRIASEATRDLKLAKDAASYDEAMRRSKHASANYQHWYKKI